MGSAWRLVTARFAGFDSWSSLLKLVLACILFALPACTIKGAQTVDLDAPAKVSYAIRNERGRSLFWGCHSMATEVLDPITAASVCDLLLVEYLKFDRNLSTPVHNWPGLYYFDEKIERDRLRQDRNNPPGIEIAPRIPSPGS